MLDVETLERLLPPQRLKILRGFGANRTALLGADLAAYNVLLFSTHAFADDRQPELSSLVLSMVDSEGRPSDGLIRLYDVYDLKLNAALVVLSACETAAGRDVRGEGLIGLARGFLYAGASGLLASAQPVDGEASAALTRAFFGAMLGPKKLTPSGALLEARRSVAGVGRWKDPYYWGALELIAGFE